MASTVVASAVSPTQATTSAADRNGRMSNTGTVNKSATGTDGPGTGSHRSEKQFDYEKALKLFTGKHSFDLYERQVAVFYKVIRLNPNGFPLRTLPYIMQLLGVGCELVRAHAGVDPSELREGFDGFEAPVCALLEHCALPFVKESASDEYRNFGCLCGTMAAIGKATLCGNIKVQLQAADTILRFAHAADAGPVGTKEAAVSSSSSYHQQVLESSMIVSTIAEALREFAGVQQLELALLQPLRELSYNKELAAQIAKAGTAPLLVKLLDLPFQHEAVFLTIEVLWNLLEYVPDCVELLGTAVTMDALTQLLTRLLTDGFRQKDKEERNEVLILALYLAKNPSTQRLFYESGFLDLVLVAATAQETEQSNPVIKSFIMNATSAEFEMKRLLWSIVCFCSSDELCLSAVAKSPFISVLLMYLDCHRTKFTASIFSKWSVHELRDLRIQALSVLFFLVAGAPEAFQALGGTEVVLHFLASSDEELQRSGALRLLLSMSRLPTFNSELAELGCMSMMLNFVDTATDGLLVNRQDALTVVSNMCDGHQDNKMLFADCNGVAIVLRNIEYEFKSSVSCEPMSLAVVDCVWNAIVGCHRNEMEFLEAEGLFALLDLLQVCPGFMHNQVLSCIVDLLENVKARPALMDWRSKTVRGMCVVQLLCQLWTAAPDRTAPPPTPPQNAHLDVDAIALPRAMTPADPNAGALSGAAFVDSMSRENLRTKIWACLNKISFMHRTDLPNSDRTILAEIESYMSLKEGQLWRIISSELREEGVRPTTPDRQLLSSLHEESDMHTQKLSDMCTILGNDQRILEGQAEGEFMSKVKEQLELRNRPPPKAINKNIRIAPRTKLIINPHKSQMRDENEDDEEANEARSDTRPLSTGSQGPPWASSDSQQRRASQEGGGPMDSDLLPSLGKLEVRAESWGWGGVDEHLSVLDAALSQPLPSSRVSSADSTFPIRSRNNSRDGAYAASGTSSAFPSARGELRSAGSVISRGASRGSLRSMGGGLDGTTAPADDALNMQYVDEFLADTAVDALVEAASAREGVDRLPSAVAE